MHNLEDLIYKKPLLSRVWHILLLPGIGQIIFSCLMFVGRVDIPSRNSDVVSSSAELHLDGFFLDSGLFVVDDAIGFQGGVI